MSCDGYILVPGSTNVVAIGDPSDPLSRSKGLHDAYTGDAINDAVCTVEAVVDLFSKVAVTGWTLPAAMVYLEDSAGVYTAETPVGLAVTRGQQVKISFKAVKGLKVSNFTKVYTVAEEAGA